LTTNNRFVIVVNMRDTTPDITRSSTPDSTTYENSKLALILATVRRHDGEWRTSCYYGPEPDECETHDWATRQYAERQALRHALDITDAL
jgi:hypothetical protein